MAMNKDTKETIKILVTVVLMIVLFIGFGFIVGSSYEIHHTTDINKQHEELMLMDDYIYCPYCGEKIGE